MFACISTGNANQICREEMQKKVTYVPVLQMLRKLLCKQDILEKAQTAHVPTVYNTCRDGSCFRRNYLLLTDDFTIAFSLYADELKSLTHWEHQKGSIRCVWYIGILPTYWKSED